MWGSSFNNFVERGKNIKLRRKMSTEKEKSQRKFNFLNKIQESAKINKEKKNRRK